MAVLLNMRPDHEVEPHLSDHLTHLRKENQRPRSIRERRLTILRVARYLGHPVAEVTRADLEAWQSVRIDQLQPTGMHNEVVHVAVYLKWLVRAGHRDDNPSDVLIRPKKLNQRLPRPMPEADIAKALAAADQPVHVWIGLAALCGLRCMEIATLAREDIIDGPRGSYLRIIGKGDKERKVDLPQSLRTELAAGPFNTTGHLFNRMDGHPGPPSAMRVSERINDHLHSLGIASTAHKLRHWFGTNLYDECRDPFLVAAAMGHASTDTTRGYVALVTDQGAQLAESLSRRLNGGARIEAPKGARLEESA